jgi:hypothetical protein
LKNRGFTGGDIEAVPLQKGVLGRGDLQLAALLPGSRGTRGHGHALRIAVTVEASQNQ